MNESNHSALKQKIGDFYHYYVALFYMIENHDWNNCDIEKNGDISLINASNEIILSIEVKYHSEETELKDNAIELWKTIKNFYNDVDKYNENTELLLYTVSIINSNNSLSNWNNLTTDEKYNLLLKSAKKKENEIYTTIKPFYDVITNDEKKLKKILAKFKIESNKEYFTKFKEKIIKNTYFRIFDTIEKKEHSLYSLMESIFSAFKNIETWNIKFEDFRKKLQITSNNAHEIIIRSDDDVDEIEIDENTYKDSLFVKKMKDIEKDDTTISFAIEDYAKTIYEIERRVDFLSPLDWNKKRKTYEQNLIRGYITTKSDFEPNEEIIIQQSQNFYKKVQNLNKIPFIPKVFNDQTTFFQNGYFHILADEDDDKKVKIVWHLGEK